MAQFSVPTGNTGVRRGLRFLCALLGSPGQAISPEALFGVTAGDGGASIDRTTNRQDRAFAALYRATGFEGGPSSPSFGFQLNEGHNAERMADLVRKSIESAIRTISKSNSQVGAHLEESIATPEETLGGWCYRDSQAKWQFDLDRDYPNPEDASNLNVFKRESDNTWHVRMGPEECQVPHSTGMEFISLLLLYAGARIPADRLAGRVSGSHQYLCVTADAVRREVLHNEFSDVLESGETLIREFGRQIHWEDAGGTEFEEFVLPESLQDFTEDLSDISDLLHRQAVEAFPKDKARFRDLGIKKYQCDRLIARVRELRRKLDQLEENAEKQAGPVQEKIGQAVDAIKAVSPRIGGYFQEVILTGKYCMFCDATLRWHLH